MNNLNDSKTSKSPNIVALSDTPEIRTTSKQVFPNIYCLPDDDNLIYCFILSVWDNIVGPQTVNVWKKISRIDDKQNKKEDDFSKYSFENSNPFQISQSNELKFAGFEKECENLNSSKWIDSSALVKYVTEHTVNVGEAGPQSAKKMVFFSLSVPHLNILVLSVRFYVVEEDVSVPYCLSALIPEYSYSPSLPSSVVTLCSKRLYQIAAVLRLYLYKSGLECGNAIIPRLREMCCMLTSLKKGNLLRFPLSSAASPPDDRVFAEKILSSHFQSMRTSLVISGSPSEANKVVMWLGRFLSNEEKSISRISYSAEFWPFQPGLLVQAAVRDSNGCIDLSSSELLSSDRPLSLVDLDSLSVRQMTPGSTPGLRQAASRDAFRSQLLALWHGLDHVPAPSQSIFETVHSASPVVKRFLREFSLLSSCESAVKEAFIGGFERSLKYTALAIVTWIENEWLGKSTPSARTFRSLFAALAATFNLDESDLKIYLAEINILRPDFLSQITEKKSH